MGTAVLVDWPEDAAGVIAEIVSVLISPGNLIMGAINEAARPV